MSWVQVTASRQSCLCSGPHLCHGSGAGGAALPDVPPGTNSAPLSTSGRRSQGRFWRTERRRIGASARTSSLHLLLMQCQKILCFFFFLRLLGSGDKNPAERAPGCHAHGAVVPLVPPRVVPVPAAPRVGAHSPSHPDVSLLPWPWLRRRPAARGNLKPQESVALRAQVHPLRSLAQLQALVCFRD